MADIVHLQGTVTQATASDGESRAVTMTRGLGLHVAHAQSAFQDAVERGRVYAVCNQAGITTQAGLSATTPALTLYNPLGSETNLVVWYAGITDLVAYAAAAAIWAAVGTNTAAAAVTGTLTTAHRNLKLGLSSNPVARTFLAATLPAAPVGICLLGAGLTGAITTVPSVATLGRWFNGALILTPGTNLSIQTSTASGTNSSLCEFIWEEVDA